jgi:hypothetical protein
MPERQTTVSPSPRPPISPDRDISPGDIDSVKQEVDSLVSQIRLQVQGSPPYVSPDIGSPPSSPFAPPRGRAETRATDDDAPQSLRLRQENVRLKAELLKTKKKLQAAQEENRRLQVALEKAEAGHSGE